MASTKEYLDFILEQLSELDEIAYKSMMGEYIIYYRGKIVGGIYDDRLGKAVNSLVITLMRNLILFIPGVIILNKLFGLDGAIAAQPVVEGILSVVCIVMYIIGIKTEMLSLASHSEAVSEAV